MADRHRPEASIELRIDALAAGGDGVGRAADGIVVFVPYTAPGDHVRARVTERRRRFARAELERVIEAGPGRAAPACAVFGSCGGCVWQHVAYPEQLEAKREILRDALRRIGGFALDEPIPMRASPAPYGYRRRARLLVEGGRVGYRRRRSRAICPTSECPILAPALERRLLELAAQPPSPAGEWELEAGEEGVRCAGPEGAGGGGAPVKLRVGDDLLEISPGVFSQANGPLLEPLAEAVHAAVGKGRSALELFAGAGFFTLGLARRFERVAAVESNPAAAGDLERNLRAAGVANVKVLAHAVESPAAWPVLAALAPEAVLLDPPREGLSAGVAQRLLELAAPRLVYLSCDPATLARDLARFARGGYELLRVGGFDLFPQTAHVEALAEMEWSR